MNTLGKLLLSMQKLSIGIGHRILPMVSPVNGDVVSSTGALSSEHWQELEFLTGCLCYRCGYPMEQFCPPETWCGPGNANKPNITRTRSALVYSDMSRRLILNFKHGGRVDNLTIFTNWMQGAANEILCQPAVLVPVPLHLFRRLHRKFNQSALLSGSLAKACKLQHKPQWLVRHRNTQSQGFKSTKNRQKNVKGAFRVPDKYLEQIKGQRIILIDDVRTSGATLEACAKTLLLAGAKQIDAITLARIVKTQETSK
ncbi:MAG: ComF family protein [Robiginitomaculum sp.]|nr:ComF family protein [Robiginitomaculum sp.]